MKKLFELLSIILLLSACKPTNVGSAFQNLEELTQTTPVPEVKEVQIESFTPTESVVVFTSTNQVTFAVSINDGAGTVNYDFILDGNQTLQTGRNPFLSLLGSSVSTGTHTLAVNVSNSQSSDSKVFTLKRNSSPHVVSYNPSLTGNMINCAQDSISFSAVTEDSDDDSFTQKWFIDNIEVTANTLYTSTSNTSSSALLTYTPACTVAGYHSIVLQQNDGYETTSTAWTILVVNPAVETLTSYFPSSGNVVALSTDASKTFSVSGTGIGTLTFTWTLDGSVVKSESGVMSTSYVLDTSSASMLTGDHTLVVTLEDGSLGNDPTTPAQKTWTVYKNQKPSILTPTPSSLATINLTSQEALTANIQDPLDTFVVSISKGALDCSPTSECGLSSVVLPTTSNLFSAVFTPGNTFLGENSFVLTVTDSHGESDTYTYNITSNYFSDYCNNLGSGRICTLVGLPGLGSGLDLSTSSNKVRVTPAWLTKDEYGNFFFSDHATNTVWYYNSLSTSVTLWGSSAPATVVAPHTLYAVAGTGVVGSGGNGQLARKMPLNFGGLGGGLAWDSVRRELYISDYGNSRIVRIAQTGIASNFCGAGATSDVQGAVASLHRCNNPVDLEFDSINKRLYAALYSSHVIKYFDVSDASVANWKGYTVVGVYGAGASTDGTVNLTSFPSTTIAGTGRLNGPWGLHYDSTDGLLYFTEYGSCRVRVLGLPSASGNTLFGTTLSAGSVYTLGGLACASAAINTDTSLSANLFNRPLDVLIHKSGSDLLGLFVSDYNGSRITFLNNSSSSVTIGNKTIGSLKANNVFGNGTTAPSNPPTGMNATVINPFGLYKVGNTLYVGAKGNNSIRTLNVGVSNGTVGTFLGGTARASYSGNNALDSQLVTLNGPTSLMYRSSNNTLYFSDSTNYMIRSVNLTNGRVEDFIGTGASADENLVNTVTTATRLRNPKAMTMFGDYFLYADGSSNNCFVRAYNPLNTDENIFNTLVSSNRTNTIAGYYNWCTSFVGTDPLDSTNSNAKIGNPYGIGVDETNEYLYIASYSSHCILRLTNAGVISPFLGTCGTVASNPVYSGVVSANDVTLSYPAELVMDAHYPGNFFFVDFSQSSTAHVKYVNMTDSLIDFWGGALTIPNNQLGTVLEDTASPGYIKALAAFYPWICYTSGTTTSGQGNHTVVCRDRDSGTKKIFGVPGLGGIQLETEHEGALIDGGSSVVTFATPSGLAFDSEGNLYVSEQGAHDIRKIKRWW